MIKIEAIQETKKLNITQILFGVIVIVLIGVFSSYLKNTNSKLSLYLITGVFFGYILTRSRFGFAGGIKRIYVTGEGSLTRALLFMFAITIIAMAGIHWFAASNGAVLHPSNGIAMIPGAKSVKALNLATIVGGFLFGIGMVLAGGCASGTLTDLGEGVIRALIVLPFFCLGAVAGHGSRYLFDHTGLAKFSATVYFPDKFGYVGAVIISFIFLFTLYAATRKYEAFRKKEGFYDENIFEEDEKALEQEGEFKLLSYNTYHRLFIERWNFFTGGLLIAVMFIFTINTTGASWGVTSEFTRWGVALLQLFGIHFNSPAYEGVVKIVNNGLLNDPGSVRNIGLIFGSSIAFLLAGRFKFNFDFKLNDVLLYILGGLLMGFGARFAKGCNIGALYAAISNFSLHGWIFLIALSLGGIAGLKMFEGKINIIPENRYKNSQKY